MLLLAFCCLVVAVVASYTSWYVAQQRLRKQLASARARWELQHQQDSPATIMETFTLGWLNLIVQALWTPVLEKHLASLTTDLLGRLFVQVLERRGAKPPWSFIEGIDVEGFSWGLVPPQFQWCFARYDPGRQYLQLAMDVRFHSSGAQGVLRVRVRPPGLLAPFTVRLEATHIRLVGRLNLGLQFTKEPPGIKGVHYSFASPPDFDMSCRPLGVSIASELPGLVSAVPTLLGRLINRQLVEPRRRVWDVQRFYRNKHVARAGGPGGLVRLVVILARDLLVRPAPGSGGHSGDSDAPRAGPGPGGAADAQAPSLSAYCQVLFGRQVVSTPIVHSGASPVFNWSFSLRLECDLDSPQLQDLLVLKVLDAQAVGDPVLLGKCKLELGKLALTANGDARTLVLPLRHGARDATIHIRLSWIKADPRKGQPAAPAPAQRPPHPDCVLTSPPLSLASTPTPAAGAGVPAPAPHPTMRVSWGDETPRSAGADAAAAAAGVSSGEGLPGGGGGDESRMLSGSASEFSPAASVAPSLPSATTGSGTLGTSGSQALPSDLGLEQEGGFVEEGRGGPLQRVTGSSAAGAAAAAAAATQKRRWPRGGLPRRASATEGVAVGSSRWRSFVGSRKRGGGGGGGGGGRATGPSAAGENGTAHADAGGGGGLPSGSGDGGPSSGAAFEEGAGRHVDDDAAAVAAAVSAQALQLPPLSKEAGLGDADDAGGVPPPPRAVLARAASSGADSASTWSSHLPAPVAVEPAPAPAPATTTGATAAPAPRSPLRYSLSSPQLHPFATPSPGAGPAPPKPPPRPPPSTAAAAAPQAAAMVAAGAQSLAMLGKVARLVAALEEQRGASVELQQQLTRAQQRGGSLVRLRRAEGRRALLQGARFLVHPPWPRALLNGAGWAGGGGGGAASPTPASPGASTPPAPAPGGGRPVLLWCEEGRVVVAALPESWDACRALKKRQGPALERFWALQGAPPRDALAGVVAGEPAAVHSGVAMFGSGGAEQNGDGGSDGGGGLPWERFKALLRPGGGGGGGGAAAAVAPASTLPPAQCFTLDFKGPDPPLHLQLPPQGNGRSRDEWAAAFSDLVDSAVGAPRSAPVDAGVPQLLVRGSRNM